MQPSGQSPPTRRLIWLVSLLVGLVAVLWPHHVAADRATVAVNPKFTVRPNNASVSNGLVQVHAATHIFPVTCRLARQPFVRRLIGK